jgi:serine/threonine protein kinase
LIEKIGEGGFGTVYSGLNINTNESVAIKIIKNKELDQDKAIVIKRELEALNLINHPNLIKKVDVI